MKKIAVLLALVILGGMTTYEFNRRYYDQTTPEQSAALLSVGSRMLDAFCDEPVEFLSLFADTVVPAELLTSVGSYLEKLHAEKGSCFGHSREDLHGGLTDVVERLHRDLVSQLYATEFQASDFLDCVVRVDEENLTLRELATEVFTCVHSHLDVRPMILDALDLRRRHGDTLIITPVGGSPVPMPGSPSQ